MSKAPATRPERVLFVHAHPDDETLSSGGTIATLLELGAEVTVLTATRGERGEMLTPELAPLFGDGPRVAAHRETEIAAALAALGGPAHLWLGGPGARPTDLPERRYTDSGMQWGPDGRAVAAGDAPSDSLTAADLGEVVDDIRAAIRSTGADAVVSYADDGGYGHPDHVRVHHAARYAARAEELPFSMIVDPDSGQADLTVDVVPVLAKVRAAVEQYRSQVTIDPVDPRDPTALSWVMPHGARHQVPAVEAFRHDADRVPPAPQTFGEFSRQGKVTAVVVALVLGLVAGGLGTVTHQQTLGAFPVGIVLTSLIVIGLTVGIRLLYRSRAMVAAVGIGIIAATQVLSSVGGQSSPLVLANAAGYVWTFGPAAVTALVLAWPDLSGIRASAAARSGTADRA
ncbi:N-acetyl-1-D-myo-inositol-2-amino-2-deoxy-alpha-D-glucopyranoside deacetylase [Curtobacterium sp. 320]|uniref:PIG-L family deacetylase n=1 Tax=Curtobacterium sp. 320 TaxID=2817749 RepID=UPI00285608D3|nr:PIG-L family deacetylase [Curtobacterium sp. 320]MDR6575064.1 N-acetyl-1-D-myo-inositol-2-amino-2-deoxy-alpha-D-glucopyranoside deacetylase [Curtobacterium sp. 320]